MIELTGLERVALVAREAVRRYALRLHAHAGENIRGLTLYGPVAGPWFDPQRHLIHSVLVLGTVDLDVLRRIAEEGHEFGKSKIPAPLVMTPAFIAASRDAFPLELIEIQQQRVTLLGVDAFAKLEFNATNVRLQCERELKSVAIAMRQAAVADGGNEQWLREAALPPLQSLLRTFRGLLWLRGTRHAQPAEAVLRQVETLVGGPLPGARRLLDDPAAAGWIAFRDLYNDVEALGHAVDAW